MFMLDIFFVIICAYLFCGWLCAEKFMSTRKEVSRGQFYFCYYLWPLALFSRKSLRLAGPL